MASRPHYNWFLIFTLATLCGPYAAQGQAVLRNPQLNISGPDGQTVVVVERYYDQGTVSKTVTSRIDIREPGVPLPLEIGHSGLKVFIVVPTQKPVSVLLADGSAPLEKATSTAAEILQISLGTIVESDRFTPPRTLLNTAERTLVARFFASLAEASTAEIVSELPAANIEWQTLDAFCSMLNGRLGERLPAEPELDGWLSWEGNLGARVISGTAQFQRGSCRFTLMEIDGKLLDVQFESNELPSLWFNGPSSIDKYVAQSLDLTRQLFSGDIAAAHALFSRQYDDQVTPEDLQDLHTRMRDQFGTEIETATLKQSTLSEYDSATESRTLSVLHSLQMANGERVLSKVGFVFPCEPQSIPRGNLAAFNVWESWGTSDPERVQTTGDALEILFSGSVEDFAALLHADLRPHLDLAALGGLGEHVRSEWGGLQREPDWDVWQTRAVGDNLHATGPIETEAGVVDASAEFASAQLIGMTLTGPSFAASTLDLSTGIDAAAEHGRSFWSSMFSHDLPTAHALLAPVLREQLPFGQFSELISASDLNQLPDLKSLELDSVRIASRLERKVPVAFAAFYIASFVDGSFQPVRCEFREISDQSGQFELLNFNTDFEIVFPVDGTATATRLLPAFLDGDPQAVIELVREDERDAIDPHVLAAFLTTLKELTQGAKIPERSRLQHVYTVGDRQERFSAILKPSTGEIPFDATLQLGYLQSFHFTLSEMANFAQHLESAEGLGKRGDAFIRLWLTEGQTNKTQPLMVPELRRDGVVQHLERLRDQMLEMHGTFLASAQVDWSASSTKNEVTSRFELDFSRATVPIDIVFRIDAIGGSILEVRP